MAAARASAVLTDAPIDSAERVETYDLTRCARLMALVKFGHVAIILVGLPLSFSLALGLVLALARGATPDWEMPLTVFPIGAAGVYSLYYFPGLLTRRRFLLDLAVFIVCEVLAVILLVHGFSLTDRIQRSIELAGLTGADVNALESYSDALTPIVVYAFYLALILAVGLPALVLLGAIGTVGRTGVRALDVAQAAQTRADGLPQPGRAEPIDRRQGVRYALIAAGVYLVSYLVAFMPNRILSSVATFILAPTSIFFVLFILRARQFFQPSYSSLLDVDKRKPILLLRSFTDDVAPSSAHLVGPTAAARALDFSIESRLASYFMKFGPFIAVGSPRETMPVIGAPRVRLADSDWRTFVQNMIQESQLTVMMVGVTPAVAWELETALRLEAAKKLLLIFPKTVQWNFRTPKLNRASTLQRYERLKVALAGTRWSQAVKSIDEPENLMAIVLQKSGGIAAIRCRTATIDSLHLATEIAHSLIERAA